MGQPEQGNGEDQAGLVDGRRGDHRREIYRVSPAKAIGQLRRERGRLTVRAIAQRAGVSVTFLYENSEARTLVSNAVDASRTRQVRAAQAEHEQIEASWRERALNAEAELGRTQKEVFAQRQQIGELMGKLRDLDQTVPGESVQALASENITLKRRVQQLTREHRTLQERLEGARSNLRFSDKRIADLEAQILELQRTS